MLSRLRSAACGAALRAGQASGTGLGNTTRCQACAGPFSRLWRPPAHLQQRWSSQAPAGIGQDGLEDAPLPPNLKLADPAVMEQHLPPPPPPPSDGNDMEVWVTSLHDGSQLEKLVLDREVFGVPMRRDVVHEVVKWQRANWRKGNAKTKTISEVSGSGAKVRPQKGSGMARAGHRRPPHWRKGAKAHGPKLRDWSFKLNKKFRLLGLKVALSARLREGKLSVVDDLRCPEGEEGKTGPLARTLKGRGWDYSALLIGGENLDEDFGQAAANIRGIKVIKAQGANVYDIVKNRQLVLTAAGVKRLQEKLAREP